MPQRDSIHIDKALTNISVKYMNDPAFFIADKVFPRVPVQKQSDRYFRYYKEDWFRDDAAERAMGTESAGGDYDIDNTPTYFCRKYAFHKDVFEEDRANADAPINVDVDATEFVVDKILLNKENNWAKTYFRSGVWGQDLIGAASTSAGTSVMFWNNPNSNPIQNIKDLATNMAEITGRRPNTLTLGRRVYDALSEHPDILDRIKFTQKGIISKDLLAAMFDMDRILVADAIQNTAEKGKEAKMSFMLGSNALLTWAPSSPALKTPSAGYSFVWTGLMGANALGGRINRFKMPHLGIGTERIECELAYDMKVVSADLGAFISNAVEVTP